METLTQEMNNNQQDLDNSQNNMAESQLQQEESYQMAENPFKVTKVTLGEENFNEPLITYDEPQAEVEQQEAVAQAESTQADQGVDDIETLRAKLAEMEAKLQEVAEPQVKVEYRMPDEVRELLDNPATLQMLNEDFENKSVLDLIKDAFKEANPWAKTDRHIEAHLRRQYPDIDFDIPENLGLAEEDYDAIAWQAEGIRQQRMAQQNEVRGRIEAAKAPAVSEVDLEGYQAAFNNLVEDGIKGIKPEALSLDIPGYKMPELDFEKVRDIVYSDNVPLSLDKEGNVWPNMKAAAAMAELEMLKSQIPAMLEAARRAAPKEAVEAINRTLNNQVPQNNTSPINPRGATANAPSFGGLRVVGVQTNF